ncbi:hypothetical protein P7C70_g8558, partial [Phenoliferia sp. Uapishka_3]
MTTTKMTPVVTIRTVTSLGKIGKTITALISHPERNPPQEKNTAYWEKKQAERKVGKIKTGQFSAMSFDPSGKLYLDDDEFEALLWESNDQLLVFPGSDKSSHWESDWSSEDVKMTQTEKQLSTDDMLRPAELLAHSVDCCSLPLPASSSTRSPTSPSHNYCSHRRNRQRKDREHLFKPRPYRIHSDEEDKEGSDKLAGGKTTRHGTKTHTTIDYALASVSILDDHDVSDIEVLPYDPNLSDHCAIRVTLQATFFATATTDAPPTPQAPAPPLENRNPISDPCDCPKTEADTLLKELLAENRL